jgi:hypothetical protein
MRLWMSSLGRAVIEAPLGWGRSPGMGPSSFDVQLGDGAIGGSARDAEGGEGEGAEGGGEVREAARHGRLCVALMGWAGRC